MWPAQTVDCNAALLNVVTELVFILQSEHIWLDTSAVINSHTCKRSRRDTHSTPVLVPCSSFLMTGLVHCNKQRQEQSTSTSGLFQTVAVLPCIPLWTWSPHAQTQQSSCQSRPCLLHPVGAAPHLPAQHEQCTATVEQHTVVKRQSVTTLLL